jgi:arginyl-tRNA synthetase
MWWWDSCTWKANRWPTFALLLDASLKQKGERIDYYCWDLYAKTSQWYTSGTTKRMRRARSCATPRCTSWSAAATRRREVAELISTAVLRRHLETMLRLDIEYDFLPRESEILHLKFWESAFEQLKKTGVLYFETEGKNKGCWVMTRPGAEVAEKAKDGRRRQSYRPLQWHGHLCRQGYRLSLMEVWPAGQGLWLQAVLHLSRSRMLDFREKGVEPHPHFGGAQAIYNVIDARQSDPQANVIQALRGMGYTEQADRYTHFSYEMVALTPRCAVELGYDVSAEDLKRPYIEVSGRKGFGVKADDLIDKLIAATRAEVDARQTGRDEVERQRIAEQIALARCATSCSSSRATR